MINEEINKRFKDTVFLVEANDFERHQLWADHSLEAQKAFGSSDGNRGNRRCTWKQLNPGFHQTIGHLDNRPISVCVFWNYVNGKLVAFYEATSQVADHQMVEDWIFKQCSPKWGGSRRAQCNAMNFHHVLSAVGVEARP